MIRECFILELYCIFDPQRAAEVGGDCGTAMCSSPFSRKIFADAGFDTWPLTSFNGIEDGEGASLFGDIIGPEVQGTGHFISFK